MIRSADPGRFGTLLLALCAAGTAAGALAAEDAPPQPSERYIFAWPFVDADTMQPRGGRTRGADVELAREPDPQRVPCAGADQSALERDRCAILAMAGPYRTSFDFLETVGYAPGFEPAAPYRSWGTEYIYVLADEAHFISLQHILVQHIVDESGEVQAPVVIKHWRQDWRYEDRILFEHVGRGVWQRRELTPEEAAGSWSQAVFQVDDSPRYESFGRWSHNAAFSSWESAPTRRPLPRRESSVRDDYDVLYGVNRHSVYPLGWAHEQDNLKAVLDPEAAFDAERPFLAREVGVNRYERLRDDHDFSAADAYWRATADFWAQVRAAWAEVMARHERFVFDKTVEDRSLTMHLFEYAQRIAASGEYDPDEARATIEQALQRHVRPAATGAAQ